MTLQLEPVVVVGAGGFGREALDVLEAMIRAGAPYRISGVLDDSPSPADLRRLKSRGISFMGPARPENAGDAEIAVAVGSPGSRRRLFDRFSGARFVTLIHPLSTLGSQVRVGEGAIICAGVSVGTNAVIGRGCHLNPNATIGHDTVLHECVSINPVANISGDCIVRAGALVGASAVVLQGRTIGGGAVVGAGAVVTRDVSDGSVVKGVPAR